MPTVADIADVLERWAPPATAQSYDNVGLLVGRRDRQVRIVVVALDLVPAVVDEAVRLRADLIVTHHPLLFRPIRTLTGGSLVSGLALRLAEAGIALYAAHTNLDAALGGVSFALAERLGLGGVDFLSRIDDSLHKLVTFVPESNEAVVRAAIAEAGAGRIGNYDSCAFAVRGTGHFRAGPGSDPFVGDVDGRVQSVDEVRLEVEVPRWLLSQVVAALKSAHPYEEVAYDVFPVAQKFSGAGLGAVGDLAEPIEVPAFLAHVADCLDVPAIRFSGFAERVSRVAVCGGAGADLIGEAIAAGANAYVTSDISYHRFFEVMDEHGQAGLLLVDAGHYETEKATEAIVADHLLEAFPDLEVRRTGIRTSVVQYHIRREKSSPQMR